VDRLRDQGGADRAQPADGDVHAEPEATWSDGKPITVRDYQAQWRALNGRNPAYQVASTTGYELVDDVRQGTHNHEVVVRFAKLYADWRALFSPLYAPATNSDPNVFNSGWVNKIRVTAGPFWFGGFDETAKTVTVVRDPRWWGNPAKLDKIVFKALESDAGIQAYLNGEVDYLPSVTTNPSSYKQVHSARGGVVREAAGPDFRHFTFNATSPVLSDVRVRRAVAMGIDRAAIARADLTGLHWPVRTMDNHFFVNTQTGYQDNSGQVGRYDPDKARRLLDEAGWNASGAVRQKAGKLLSLRFVILSGIPTSRNEAELTQALLKNIGVRVDIQTVPSADFFDQYIFPGNFDITAFSWLGSPFVSSSQSIYRKPGKDAKGQPVIWQNYARVGSDQIDKLLSSAGQELDPVRSRALFNQADRLIWDEVHSLTIFQRPQISSVKKGVANLGSFGFASRIYEDIGYQKG
jgi:peptide/nickel transport system substrate-binding protein